MNTRLAGGRRQAAVLFIAITVVIDVLGFGVIIPVLPRLVQRRIASGICASSFSTSFAYIADVTAPDKRASAFGLIGAAFGIGFVLGPALGGVLGDIGPRLPFWGAAGLALLSACYGFFVLPESLPPGRRDAFRWRKANPVGAFYLAGALLIPALLLALLLPRRGEPVVELAV